MLYNVENKFGNFRSVFLVARYISLTIWWWLPGEWSMNLFACLYNRIIDYWNCYPVVFFSAVTVVRWRSVINNNNSSSSKQYFYNWKFSIFDKLFALFSNAILCVMKILKFVQLLRCFHFYFILFFLQQFFSDLSRIFTCWCLSAIITVYRTRILSSVTLNWHLIFFYSFFFPFFFNFQKKFSGFEIISGSFDLLFML